MLNNEYGIHVLTDTGTEKIFFQKIGHRNPDLEWHEKWWGNVISSNMKIIC